MWFGSFIARDAVARLMYSAQAWIVVSVAYFTPHSVPALSIMGGAGPLFLALIFLATLLLIDVLINDVLPLRYKVQWGIRYRYMVYPLVAFIYISQLFVAQKTGVKIDLGVLLNYATMGFFGFLLGFRSVLFHGDQPCEAY